VRDVGYKKIVISLREVETNELNLKKALEATKISDKPQAAILSDSKTEVDVNDEMTGYSLPLTEDWKAWRAAHNAENKLARQ
jgi:hypothetical protein